MPAIFFALVPSLSMSLSIWTSILTEVGQNIDGMWTGILHAFLVQLGMKSALNRRLRWSRFLPFFRRKCRKIGTFFHLIGACECRQMA